MRPSRTLPPICEGFAVLDKVRPCIDYDEIGAGPTIVLVPGSCSTGAAWRPVIAALQRRFRCVTTSLLGYGATAERRSASDASIWHEADALEWVIRNAGGPVHLVGHSFGGLVSLAVALRGEAELISLTILEAPAVELFRDSNEHRHYQAIRAMTADYFSSFEGGNPRAIAAMIDFYGGEGTFDSWLARVRAYAMATTPVNILDWASAYGFALSAASLQAIEIPTLVATGSASHPAMRTLSAHLGECIGGANLVTIEGAAHFMIATHADEVAALVAEAADRAERGA